jgi:hypothetical protein
MTCLLALADLVIVILDGAHAVVQNVRAWRRWRNTRA